MRAGFVLSQQQIQSLRLSPTLQQSLHILQYSQSELFEHIQDLCSTNPFAEWVSPPTPWLRVRPGIREGGRNDITTMESFEQAMSLVDHLFMQLSLYEVDTDTKHAIQYMIGSLNDSGYLVESVDRIADVLSMQVSVVEHALKLFQSFDPPGIGARNLRECLLAQIDAIPEQVRPLAFSLVDQHLEEVATKQWESLAGLLDVPTEGIRAAVDAIRKLQPRPAFGYTTEHAEVIVPDIMIENVGGKWLPRLNVFACPRIRVAPSPVVSGQNANEPSAVWYRQRVAEVEQVITMLERRAQTLTQVAAVITDVQQEFFDIGVHGLKPMTLKLISSHTGLHVSTVSRAVQSKYMATPKGLYPIRYFFSSQVPGVLEEGVSSKVVKAHLRSLVQSEDGRRPWSDESIRMRLLELGISISRRTIAQYREQLHIPASRQRRRRG